MASLLVFLVYDMHYVHLYHIISHARKCTEWKWKYDKLTCCGFTAKSANEQFTTNKHKKHHLQDQHVLQDTGLFAPN